MGMLWEQLGLLPTIYARELEQMPKFPLAMWFRLTHPKQHGNPEGMAVSIKPYFNPWIEFEKVEERMRKLHGKSDFKPKT